MIDYSQIDPSWHVFFEREKSQPYYHKLEKFIQNAYEKGNIFPPIELVFKVFHTKLKEIKVVILGQDPYPTKGHAMGLSFSTSKEVFPLPKSLVSIRKEIDREFNKNKYEHGDLSYLSEQGVFLLNTILTVEEGKPLSHKRIGWEIFTLNVLRHLQGHLQPSVFLLWGRNAHALAHEIDSLKHLIIQTSHPSPLGYTKSGKSFTSFKGSNQFHQCNLFLTNSGRNIVEW
jgi:uracil-DNA glycosylase